MDNSSSALVAIAVLVSPLLSAWMTKRDIRKAKEKEIEREDTLRKEANDKLDKVAERAELVASAAALAAQIAAGERKVIHHLVNSAHTRVLQEVLDSTKREHASLQEIAALHRAAGREPSEYAKIVIANTEKKIVELTEEIEKRTVQDKLFFPVATHKE